ncbi:lysostaphin resistance A-like protein [Singulisphaera sp. PoT]|uniref:CPBP family intramembrane glutamic endopeptidase n=1 Tax=Singulisphaera sp. PoT TaxID=3411797 RepID=UPI003BF5C6E4
MAIDDEVESDGDEERTPEERQMILVAAVLFEAALAPLALMLGEVFEEDPFARFDWDWRGAVFGVLATVPMLLFLFVAVRWPIGPLGRIVRIFDRAIAPLLRDRPISDFVLLSLAAGIGEELLFRGFLQGTLEGGFNRWTALGLTATIFGLLHPITVTYILVAGFLGAYLGVVWIYSGNLLAVMVAHALYDFVALCLLLRGRPDRDAGADEADLHA